MIAFITEKWQLDLTGHKITFVEESSLFYDYLVNNYSLPFTLLLDDEIAVSMGFIGENNITDTQTRYRGILQQDNHIYPATLEIDSFDGERLSGSFEYGPGAIPLLDMKLKDLPWPVITTDSITAHAKTIIGKQYPEVGYNFPMIIDTEFHKTTNYENFQGIINQYNGTGYITNSKTTLEGEEVINNRNVVTPYPYIMEILRVGFTHAGLSYGGDFFSDTVNQKLIWDTKKYLEQLFNPFPPNYSFGLADSETHIDNMVVSVFEHTISVQNTGSYTIKVHTNFPEYIHVGHIRVLYKGEELFTSDHRIIDEIVTLNVETSANYGVLSLEMELYRYDVTDNIENISGYNSYTFWQNDGKLNVFPNVFTLADVMPDMKFSTFLNKLANWLNLEIKFSNHGVVIDYIENSFIEKTFIDESHLEQKKYPREYNTNKTYHLKGVNGDVYVSRNGIEESLTGLKEDNIKNIELGVDIMEIQKSGDYFTAYRKQDRDFQLLIYDGLQNGLPVAIPTIDNLGFKPVDIYNRFWKNWIHYRTNSETIKDQFDCEIFETLTTEIGKYKYNKKMLVKKITKRRKDKDIWEVRTESETI